LQRRELFVARGAEIDPPLEGLGELGPLARALEEPVERAVGVLLLVAVLGEDASVRDDRVLGVRELVLVETGLRVRELAARIGIVLELDASLVDLEQLRVAVRLPVEITER